MNICVIITAGGVSSRFNGGLGADRSKLDEDLGGRPVLHRTVELFTKRADVGSIIVAGPHDDERFGEFKLRHADKLAILGVTLVKGGLTHRWETVKAALEHAPESATHIAVHDAARPGTPPELIERLFETAKRHAAVIPALTAGDTIKRVQDADDLDEPADPLAAILGDAGMPKDKPRRVADTLDRTGLVLAQTPQVFERSLLERAYSQDNLSGTDDAQLVERLGEPVLVIEGDLRNMKITTPGDLRALRSILGLHGSKGRAAHKRF